MPSPIEVEDESEETIMEHVSAWSSRTGMYAKVADFMSNPNSAETMILKELAQGFQELDKVFKAAAGAAMRGVAEYSVSLSAKASSLMIAYLSKPLHRHSFCWFAIAAELVANATAVTIPKGYAAKFADWRGWINTAHKELELVNKELAAQRNTSNKQRQLKKVVNANAMGFTQRIVLKGDMVKRTIELHRNILNNQVKNLHTVFENVGGLGFLAFLFNAIALGDAISTIKHTGLVSKDDALDVQQKMFYVATAWTGIRTWSVWNRISASKKLRGSSLNALRSLVENNDRFSGLVLDDLKLFNKWLATTACLGMLASGIEAYRSFERIDQTYGVERSLQWMHFSALGLMTSVGLFQTIGGATGALSANILFGGPVMAGLLVLTLMYLWSSSALDGLKQDQYQKWLDKLPWGYHPERTRWSQAATLVERQQQDSQLVQQALFELDTIAQQPTVYHKPIEQVHTRPGLAQYVDTTVVGVKVHIQVPNLVAKQGLILRTNTTQGKSVYSVILPVRDNMRYLALRISYPSEEGERHYWLQYSLAQTASYSVISDSSKQETITQTLSNTQGEIASQGEITLQE
ncbi:hypothetical protein ABS858_18475 [Vibrio neptunius]|uniref:hypothetical protein n=1 Tax=Vibrio neptunius TaxID=170651 RepID=UPI00331548FC